MFDQLNAVVEAARPESEPGDAEGLIRVIDAVWDWVEQNPDEARLYQVQVASANGSVKVLRDEFEQRHVQRGYDYLPEGTTRSPRAAKVRHASQALAGPHPDQVLPGDTGVGQRLAYRTLGHVHSGDALVAAEGVHTAAHDIDVVGPPHRPPSPSGANAKVSTSVPSSSWYAVTVVSRTGRPIRISARGTASRASTSTSPRST
ncbi:hypothetical protein SVIOM74S_02957 [Streptomyces violarus]